MYAELHIPGVCFLQGHIVAEVCDLDNEPLVKMVGCEHVQTVVSHDIIGRLMIQCARQHGLAAVWQNIMGFEGEVSSRVAKQGTAVCSNLQQQTVRRVLGGLITTMLGAASHGIICSSMLMCMLQHGVAAVRKIMMGLKERSRLQPVMQGTVVRSKLQEQTLRRLVGGLDFHTVKGLRHTLSQSTSWSSACATMV